MTAAIQPRVVGISIVLLAAAMWACDGDAPQETDRSADASAAAETEPQPAVEAPVPAPEEVVPDLEDGEHGAFGIRMPRGMIPIEVPAEDVYRFEGTHELHVVRRYLARQLEVPAEPAQGPGGEVVFRQALAISQEGQGEEIRLAVRVFPGSLGGASVDIWREAAGLDRGRTSAASGASASDERPPGWIAERPDFGAAPVPKDRYERRRQVWEMMEKVNRGEKLSPADLENPYFN
jgi:hypothetical protein